MNLLNLGRLLRKSLLALMLTSALLLLSCKTEQAVVQIPVTSETIIIDSMVAVALPTDSLILKAYFKCDSTNQVLLQQIGESKTGGLASDYSLKDGTFTYKVRTVRDTIYVKQTKWITIKDKPIIVEKPIYTNHFYWWQTTLMWLGVAFILLALMVVYKHFKKD